MPADPAPQITTLGALRGSGYTSRSVRDELRSNLIAALRSGQRLFSGIHGYEETVIPHVENAILAGQDIILLGERGQAKTRLARSLTSLLDPWIPIIAGSETNDDPLAPISAFGRSLLHEQGDAMPVTWIPRADRFAEKLATPDTTIADLIGEVDPIKVAEGRYLSNEEVLHFGLIPRTNRGIFNLNELPDLAERIQVGLLNILEEKDVQIRGFQVRMPLDLFVIASANPEDYTNRGRIITPLKDRFGAQIRTHYPATIAHELQIVDQERHIAEIPGVDVQVPSFMRAIVAEISRIARSSPEISQRSGVSVRMTIANYEAIVANAQRRALLTGEVLAVPRVADLPALTPTIHGKIELDAFGSDDDHEVIRRVVDAAVARVFAPLQEAGWIRALAEMLAAGAAITVGDMLPATELLGSVALAPDVTDGLAALSEGEAPEHRAAALEFALEGLYLSGDIEKQPAGSRTVYTPA